MVLIGPKPMNKETGLPDENAERSRSEWPVLPMCPECGSPVRLSANKYDKILRCPGCRAVLDVKFEAAK
jgi:hypothetical protein